jgi:predicted aspartyl protease
MRAAAALLVVLMTWCAALAAAAECVVAPAGAATSDAERDRVGRVIAPVSVNGQGPFRFIVDTGANRSALSRPLADQLSLAPVGTGEVHSVSDVSIAPLVPRQTLRFEALALDAGVMPLLDRDVLGGADGLLGVDAMSGRRLLIDFERGCVEIAPSRGARTLRGWVSIRGELRFGNLVLINGAVERTRVRLLLDTGSASTLANEALHAALGQRARRRNERAFTAGDPLVLESAVFLPRIRLADIEIANVTAFTGDFHIFSIWDLDDEPALLIGMDVLSQAGALAIDYERGIVHFRRPR